MDVNDAVVCSSSVDSGAATVVDANSAAGDPRDGEVVVEALRDLGNSMVRMASRPASQNDDEARSEAVRVPARCRRGRARRLAAR